MEKFGDVIFRTKVLEFDGKVFVELDLSSILNTKSEFLDTRPNEIITQCCVKRYIFVNCTNSLGDL